jgi:hypothetical protein
MTPSATLSDISGPRYRRFLTASALSARTCVIHETVHYTLTFTYGEKERGDRSGHHLTAVALLSRSDVIRIVFSQLISSSLVCKGATGERVKFSSRNIQQMSKHQSILLLNLMFKQIS